MIHAALALGGVSPDELPGDFEAVYAEAVDDLRLSLMAEIDAHRAARRFAGGELPPRFDGAATGVAVDVNEIARRGRRDYSSGW